MIYELRKYKVAEGRMNELHDRFKNHTLRLFKKHGIKTIWALSLPGKVAPLTSAEFIKDTIYNIFKEMQ